MTGIIQLAAHSSLKGSRNGAARSCLMSPVDLLIDRPYDSDAASSGRPQIPTTKI